MQRLTTALWTSFLLSRDSWSERSRAIAQTAYRACLDEVAKVLDAAGTDMHRALFGVCFGQGTRPSEVLQLRWEDVDWEGQTILIRGTKTELSLRTVPMTEATRVELERYWRPCKKRSNGLAFLLWGKPFASWRKAFKKSVERSGIDPDKTRRIVRYSGRYTFATLGAVASIPKAAMKLGMGHKGKSRILEDRYERIRLQQAQGLLRPPVRRLDGPRHGPGSLRPGRGTARRGCRPRVDVLRARRPSVRVRTRDALAGRRAGRLAGCAVTLPWEHLPHSPPAA